MDKVQKQVLEFHKTFGSTINTKPTYPTKKDAQLRANLILEEACEFAQAAGFSRMLIGCNANGVLAQVDPDSYVEEAQSLVEMADAIADINYVVAGAAVTIGIDAEAIGDEVHRSNMSKVWDDGTVHYREDGKVMKPPTYSPADIRSVLDKQVV